MNTKKTIATIFAAMLVTVGLTSCGSNEEPAAVAPTPAQVVEEETAMTTGQENAVRNAETMMEINSFSKDGLVRQLSEFNGFELEDAQFAVDQLDVDWAAEAVRSAERHLEITGYSAAGMYELLHEFEKFTPEQADAAVAAVGLE